MGKTYLGKTGTAQVRAGVLPKKIPQVPNFVSGLEIRAAKMPIGFGDGGREDQFDRSAQSVSDANPD